MALFGGDLHHGLLGGYEFRHRRSSTNGFGHAPGGVEREHEVRLFDVDLHHFVPAELPIVEDRVALALTWTRADWRQGAYRAVAARAPLPWDVERGRGFPLAGEPSETRAPEGAEESDVEAHHFSSLAELSMGRTGCKVGRSSMLDWTPRRIFLTTLFVGLLTLGGLGAYLYRRGEGATEAADMRAHPLQVRLELAVEQGVSGPDASGWVDAEFVAYRELEGGAYGVAVRATATQKGPQFSLFPGSYWLIGRVKGFARVEFPVVVTDQDITRHWVLEPAHQLTVEVKREVEGTYEPFPDATVLITPSLDVSMFAPSDPNLDNLSQAVPFGSLSPADGRVSIQDLPRGPYRVRVFARGYEPYEATTQADVLVVLRPVEALKVVVLRDSKPVEGARVHVVGVGAWPPRTLLSGPGGAVTVVGLRAGRYGLTAEHGEFVSATPSFVELSSGAGEREIHLELAPARELLIHVRSKQKEPVGQARLTFAPHSPYESARRGETDATGLFRAHPLSQLEGTVQVAALGYVPQNVEVRGQSSLIIELERGGTLRGRVVDDEGNPVPSAQIRVAGTDGAGQPILLAFDPLCTRDTHFEWAESQSQVLVPAGELGVLLGPVPPIPLRAGGPGPCPTATSLQPSRMVSDASGRFVVTGVPPGEVVALAVHPDYLSGRSRPSSLGAGASAELEIVLGRGTALVGRVVDHRDFPVAQALLRLSGKGYEQSALTTSDGSFRLAATPPEVSLRIFAPERPGRVALELRLGEKNRSEAERIVLPEPVEPVEIRVRDARGGPVELAQVVLRSLEAGAPWTETRFTDRSGSVRFEAARGIRAQLRVEAPGLGVHDFERRLGANELVELQPQLWVRGRVTAVRGRWPAAGALVRLNCEARTVTVLTDDAGGYRTGPLPPGRCRLQVEHPEYARASREVLLELGAHERDVELADVDLAEALAWRGEVVDESGAPVHGAIVSATPLPPFLPELRGAWPLGHVLTDAEGHFELLAEDVPTLRLYGADGLHREGEWSGSSVDGRRGDVHILLRSRETVAPDVVATVLIGLKAEGGKLFVELVLPSHEGTRALEKGDEILAIDGERPESLSEARQLLSGPAHTEVEVRVERLGRERTFRVRRELFYRGR